MDLRSAETERFCPRDGIAAYLDGELSPSAELALEKHFAECGSCLAELNAQKEMLGWLDFAFDKKAEIEIPRNFAKVVATNAESRVSGLRSRKERSLAFLFCAAMLLLALVSFGTDAAQFWTAFSGFIEQFSAVTNFIFHLFYGIGVGISVILKAVSQQILFDSVLSFAAISGLFFVSFVWLSRLIYRQSR